MAENTGSRLLEKSVMFLLGVIVTGVISWVTTIQRVSTTEKDIQFHSQRISSLEQARIEETRERTAFYQTVNNLVSKLDK
jgi:hypothetical protein